MTRQEASSVACNLWEKWVSARPAVGMNGYLNHSDSMDDYRAYDLETIHDSMLRESRWHRTGRSGATPGLIREVKGELVLLGKVRKALAGIQ